MHCVASHEDGGGLGLRSASRKAPAAFWASWADALHMIDQRLPRVSRTIVGQLTGGDVKKAIQEPMMNDEQGRPAVQAQGINEKYCRRVESFTGEQAWRDWSFQSKSATKMANEATYHLIETAEKKEKEIDDALSLSEEGRS